jgi:hypothetical protein
MLKEMPDFDYATNRTVAVPSGSRSTLNGIPVVVTCVRHHAGGRDNSVR